MKIVTVKNLNELKSYFSFHTVLEMGKIMTKKLTKNSFDLGENFEVENSIHAISNVNGYLYINPELDFTESNLVLILENEAFILKGNK